MALDDELRMLDQEILRIPLPYRLLTVAVGFITIGYFCCSAVAQSSPENILGGVDGGYISSYDSGNDTGRY